MSAPSLANLSPQRVLIIKPSAIGDIVHTLPVLNLVRRKWPGAKISWLVTPVCSGLLEGHPLLDEVILFDRKRWGGMWKSPRLSGEWRRFTRELRERRFDLVLDLQGLFRSGWLAWRTGAGSRVAASSSRCRVGRTPMCSRTSCTTGPKTRPARSCGFHPG